MGRGAASRDSPPTPTPTPAPDAHASFVGKLVADPRQLP
jgi:hypothetical protein